MAKSAEARPCITDGEILRTIKTDNATCYIIGDCLAKTQEENERRLEKLFAVCNQIMINKHIREQQAAESA